jgi:hypothetical protein
VTPFESQASRRNRLLAFFLFHLRLSGLAETEFSALVVVTNS